MSNFKNITNAISKCLIISVCIFCIISMLYFLYDIVKKEMKIKEHKWHIFWMIIFIITASWGIFTALSEKWCPNMMRWVFIEENPYN